MSMNLIKLISEEKIYPIIRCKDALKAEDIANALIEGGIKVLEINIENPSLYEVIEKVSQKAVVCAGSIITNLQASQACQSGAKLFSSPIFQMNMVKISKNIGVPFIAGTSTANEAYTAWKSRIPLIKLYPVTAMGGVQYFEELTRQMPFLNLMPMGNIKLSEVKDYIKCGATAVGVGRDFYETLSLNDITNKAKNILGELKELS